MVKQKVWLVGLVWLCILIVMAGCNQEQSDSNSDDGKVNVVTTIAQIGEPLSVIGGDRIEVESLMGPGVDPHAYNATQGDIATIEEADMVFYNGLDLEANMIEIFNEIGESNPVLAIAETVPEEALLEETDGAVDPHIWFDLELWKDALDSAVEELKEYSPEDAEYLEENKQEYFAKIDEVKQDAEKLKDIPEDQRILVTAHDAFGYFGEMHDLEVVGLQGLSTEDEIGVSDINDTIATVEEHEVPAIFVETSVNQDSIQAVIEGAEDKGLDLELGGELFSDAMGEPGTEEGTYLGMYRHNVNTIYEALTEGND
ncbi:manganese/zinc/iron transport system substrate-binding protein [Alkalibacillus flavidus]|uniref:Manganese/zinc/iron transport system substrate-binding protein n=1 Tax=Alkalibacillus flavidus TaxID=546021 RepID=A0ABV2KTI7_9BACI